MTTPPRHVIPAVVLVVALAAIPLAGAAGSPITAGPPVTYSDPAGDSGIAPDITAVVISNESDGRLDIRIDIPSQPELPGNARLFFVMNTDIDLTTGAPGFLGGDYLFELSGADRTFGFYRWDGSLWQPTATAALVSYASGARISLNRSELGNTDEFGFYAKSLADGTGSEDGRVDFVPNSSTETYLFPLPIPEPPAVSLQSVVARASSTPRAGRRLEIRVSAVLDVEGTQVSTAPSKLACTATVGGRRIATSVKRAGSLARLCSLVLPADARGKRLVLSLKGTVSTTVEGSDVRFTASFAKTVRLKVR